MAITNQIADIPEEKAGTMAMLPFVGKSTFGYYQYLKGLKEQDSLVRPTYEIPEEIKQNLTQAQLQAIQGLPEAQQRAYIENITRSMTANLASLTGRRSGLVGVSGLAQTETDAYKDLLGMDVLARQTNQKELMSQRAAMGDQKAMQWQINQMQPYLRDYNRAQGLIGMGTQNMMQGNEDLTKLGMQIGGEAAKAAMMA